MASNLAPLQILRTTCWSVDAEQAAASVFHFRVNSVGSVPATDQDLADAVSTQYSAILSLMSVQSEYRGCEAQVIWPLPVFNSVQSTIGQGPGTGGVNVMPRQCTGLTSWYGPLAGRRYRGRTYWPFPDQSQSGADGKPVAGYVTEITLISAAIMSISAISAGGRTAVVELGIYHKALHSTDKVLTKIVRPVFATQRRRGSEGRPNSSPI